MPPDGWTVHPAASGERPDWDSPFVEPSGSKFAITRVLTDEGVAAVVDLPRDDEGRPRVYCPFCGRRGRYWKKRRAKTYTEHFGHLGSDECVQGDLDRAFHAAAIREVIRRLVEARVGNRAIGDMRGCVRCERPMPLPFLPAQGWTNECIEDRVELPDGYRIPDVVVRHGQQVVAVLEVAYTSFVEGKRYHDLVAHGAPGAEYSASSLLLEPAIPHLPRALTTWNRGDSAGDFAICAACRKSDTTASHVALLVENSRHRSAACEVIGREMGFGEPGTAAPEHLSWAASEPERLAPLDRGVAVSAAKRGTLGEDGLRRVALQALGWPRWGPWGSQPLAQVLSDPFAVVRNELCSATAKGRAADGEGLVASASHVLRLGGVNPEPHQKSIEVLVQLLATARAGSTVVGLDRLRTSMPGTAPALLDEAVAILSATGTAAPAPCGAGEGVGLCQLVRWERAAAIAVAERCVAPASPPSWLAVGADQLNEEQREACRLASSRRIAVIAGAAGTGKTHTARYVMEQVKGSWLALAPTWKALGRLREALTGVSVTVRFMTVAGFVAECIGKLPTGEFSGASNRHLASGWNVLVDEVGFLEAEAFHDLMQGCALATRVVLLGDPEQLPSVGPGAVLRDLLRVEQMPHVVLRQVVRCSNSSGVPALADSILRGEPRFEGRARLREAADREILDLAREAYVKARGSHPAEAIQVISPLNRVVNGLNPLLQRAANPRGMIVGDGLRVGDPVLVAASIGAIAKGELGVIEQGADGLPRVRVGDRSEALPRNTPLALELAYCLTVHKAQGSEWDWVLLVMPTCKHDDFYDRSLLYTATTRARLGIVVLAQRAVLDAAARHAAGAMRQTALGWFLARSFRGSVPLPAHPKRGSSSATSFRR